MMMGDELAARRLESAREEERSVEARSFEALPRFHAQVAWTLLVRVLMAVASVAAGVVVARWLGADGLGKLAVLNVTAAMCVQVGSLGLPSASVYFIARDRSRLASIALNSLVFAFLTGGLLALLIYLAAEISPGLFGSVSPALLGLAAVSIPFQLVSLLGLNIFLALGRVVRFNFLELAGQLLLPINAALALMAFRAGLPLLVLLNTTASVSLSLLIVFSLGQEIAARGVKAGRVRADTKLLKSMTGYGLKSHVAAMAGILIFRADLLIVNHFRGAHEAGVYAVASQVSMMLMLLPGVVATLLFPRIAAGDDACGKASALITRHTAFVMLMVCLGSVPLSFLLPVFYGAQFADAMTQLLILLPGVYLVSIEAVMVQHFNAAGVPRAIPLFWIVTLAVNLTLTLLLVPGFGARGAALSSSLSYALIFALVALYFRRKTGRRLSEALVLRGEEMRELIDSLRRRRSARVPETLEEAGRSSS
jgi:O-antigen/teichoic acid export membrane protein